MCQSPLGLPPDVATSFRESLSEEEIQTKLESDAPLRNFSPSLPQFLPFGPHSVVRYELMRIGRVLAADDSQMLSRQMVRDLRDALRAFHAAVRVQRFPSESALGVLLGRLEGEASSPSVPGSRYHTKTPDQLQRAASEKRRLGGRQRSARING